MRSSSASAESDIPPRPYAAGTPPDQRRTRRRTSTAAARTFRWRRCWRRQPSTMSPAPAAVPMATAATGRTQLRGSRIDDSSQPSSSSAASSVRLRRVVSRRAGRSSGGSTGASARRMMSSKLSGAAWSLMCASTPPCLANVDDLLQLLDRSMDQHLGGAVAAPHRPRDLAVVHAQREAHDQRLAAVVGQLLDPVEDPRELVPPLDEVLGRVDGRQRRRVVDRRLRAPRPVPVQVRGQIVRDADEPRSQRAAVALVHRPLEVAVRLEEGLLRQVLGVVVVAHPVVGVGVDVPQVCSVELRELAVDLRLVHARQPTQAARERRGGGGGTATRAAPAASGQRETSRPAARRAAATWARNGASADATATAAPPVSAPAAPGPARYARARPPAGPATRATRASASAGVRPAPATSTPARPGIC